MNKETADKKVKDAIQKVKSRRKLSLYNSETRVEGEKPAYRRVIAQRKALTLPVNQDQVGTDISVLAQARINIMNILENDHKLENFTYHQRQGMLYFLNKYLLYLRSSVALKTKFMSTSISFTLPSDLRLGAFQKRTILDFHKTLMDKLESVIYALFYHYNLYNTAYLLSSDNWNEQMANKLEATMNIKDEKDRHPVLHRILNKLLIVRGLKVNDMFRYFEKNPQMATDYFKETIFISENEDFKKLEDIFNLDEDKVSLSQLDKMRKLAFPLLDNLEFLDMCRPYEPAFLGDSTAENIDTGTLKVELLKSELLMAEPEFTELTKKSNEFHARWDLTTNPDMYEDEEYLEDAKALEDAEELAISTLVFKGYSKPWIDAHFSNTNGGKIEVTNDSFEPLHIFRFKSASTLEDESNADSLLESGIDLLSCEVRQRSHLNDMRDKLVAITISAAAEASLNPEVIDSIVDDIASIISIGEASVISLPDGISLTDHTEIIRASNDTDRLSIQAKNNIALFFGMSTSLLEDSETQFSNTYLKTDTAQNVFSQEREVITRLIEDKLLRPASVKAGFFCKNDQGKTVIAYPTIKFNRISIGRHSEDYSDLKAMVDEGKMPKEKLYEYHNTSKEEIASKMIEDTLSINNPKILEALTDKIMNLLTEDKSGNIMTSLVKGNVTELLKILSTKTSPENSPYTYDTEETTKPSGE